MPTCPEPEFSRPIAIAQVTGAGFNTVIEANPHERKGLARRFGIPDVLSFKAAVRIRPLRAGRMMRVEGRIDARVVQRCVVTLEPFESDIAETFVAVFAEPELLAAPGRELDLSFEAEEEEEPEPIVSGRIDIAETASQHLALALDPYPRKPGAAFTELVYGKDEEAGETPFGALQTFKRRP